jgi:hypothetical protein
MSRASAEEVSEAVVHAVAVVMVDTALEDAEVAVTMTGKELLGKELAVTITGKELCCCNGASVDTLMLAGPLPEMDAVT